MGFRRYRRRFSSRRRIRRNYRSRRRVTPSFRRKVKKVIMKTSELKYWDGVIAPFEIFQGGSATVIPLWSGIASGTDVSQRIGNRIYARWGRFKLDIGANNQVDAYIRISFIRARSSNYGVGDMIQTIYDFWDPEKFTVLSDRTYNMGDASANAMNKKFIQQIVRFNSNLRYDNITTQAPINPYYVHFLSNDNVSPAPRGRGTYRLYYKDI